MVVDRAVRRPRQRPGRARTAKSRTGRLAAALELLVAVGAVSGGAAMLADPDGGLIGFPPSMLDRLPVRSWTLPGLALVLCNGVAPTVTAVAALRGRHWPGRWGHLLVGAAVTAWPVTETILFDYPLDGEPVWLRPGVALVGLMIAGVGALSGESARRWRPRRRW
jgi:hypothetical protein